MAGSRPLEGQVAWVTGSSRGLGRAMATHLGRLGAAVAVHGTTLTSARAFGEAESLEQVARDVAAETGSRVVAVWADLTDPTAVKAAAAQIRAALGPIDILVNNAGGDIGPAGAMGPRGGKPEQNDCVFISVEDLRAVLDRNLLSCILVCREVVPEMMERRAGRIVNIGSVAGLSGRAQGAMYATAKAAVHEYTRCLAAQLRVFDIPVNCVAPGGTLSPRFLATGQADPGVLEKGDVLEGYGRAEDIARAVEFFVTAAGRHVSGQVLRVDGGEQTWPA
ncbi:MAG TPA: SDR family NAD(P)-dependent oxidoreductase [Methylomirabilota bacterium]|nr:SDR family NAD(P)-dependent oxidoreductase [Methylomirabilota bacterium]HEV8673038.1 SDR family NAD(P)-dependent oxidoreductase [Methylomirabilota bacterium]